MATKGISGFSRRPLEASKSKLKGGGQLWIVGSDSIKTRIYDQLARGKMIRFSDTLSETFYEQLCSERVIVRQAGGKPTKRFERIRHGCRSIGRAHVRDRSQVSITANGRIVQSAARRIEECARTGTRAGEGAAQVCGGQLARQRAWKFARRLELVSFPARRGASCLAAGKVI